MKTEYKRRETEEWVPGFSIAELVRRKQIYYTADHVYWFELGLPAFNMKHGLWRRKQRVEQKRNLNE